MVNLSMIKMANKFKDKPRTRQDVREAARKPKGTKSAREIGMKKWSKAVPTKAEGLRAGFAYKQRTPNPLSAGGGKTYIVNGKLVSKQKFLEAKRKSPSHQGALARRKIGMARLPKRKKK